MPPFVVRAADRRQCRTPNAEMTTSASPSQGGSRALSLWWVQMAAGAEGPLHVFDGEQLWSLIEGSAEIDLDGDRQHLQPGDTAVLPAGVPRRIRALTAVRAVVCGPSTTRVSVPGETQDRGTPPWVS